jgi:hypothetical protein
LIGGGNGQPAGATGRDHRAVDHRDPIDRSPPRQRRQRPDGVDDPVRSRVRDAEQ